jgi:hypothetical protein
MRNCGIRTAVEYRANCLTVYALAQTRLDEALADRNWTACDQIGDYQNLPPGRDLDLDETVLDNSPMRRSGASQARQLSWPDVIISLWPPSVPARHPTFRKRHCGSSRSRDPCPALLEKICFQ